MKVAKEQVKVKIKTESTILNGTVYTMVNGRLSDYITSHVGKFIPVTDAEVYHLDREGKKIKGNGVKRDIVFINVEKIEMIEYL
ncbi:MAG: hypothetical protein JW770_02785 [Actinobacteria bacterium]|nr:hypothetical protein [Actinomycetota bacterium]